MTTTTSIARTPDLDVLLALCCVCGTTRTVSRRAVGSDGNRPLRCETCRKTTPHAAIGAEGRWDNGEEQNRRTKPTLSVADKLDVLRALGVQVVEGPIATDIDRDYYLEVHWDPELDMFKVRVDLVQPEQLLHERLDDALERVKDPEARKWWVQRDGVNVRCNIAWWHHAGR